MRENGGKIYISKYCLQNGTHYIQTQFIKTIFNSWKQESWIGNISFNATWSQYFYPPSAVGSKYFCWKAIFKPDSLPVRAGKPMIDYLTVPLHNLNGSQVCGRDSHSGKWQEFRPNIWFHNTLELTKNSVILFNSLRSISNSIIIGSDNGLSPGRRQAII